MEEVWKDIQGYEGLYQISNLGNVKGLDRYAKNKNSDKMKIKGQILNLCTFRGYYVVVLCKRSKGKRFLVHRLVAEAFIPNPENKPEVNHIDGDKTNNTVKNLEWCTSKENSQHAWKTGLCKVLLGKDNKNSKKILQIDLDTGEIVGTFYGTGDIKRKYGYSSSPIIRCCNNQRKTAYKYFWQYE